MSIVSFIKSLLGDVHASFTKEAAGIVQKVNLFKDELQSLSQEELRARVDRLKEEYQKTQSFEEILPEAFALVREASTRTLGITHYDVQVVGGYAIHKGMIAEMRTGEGKTLVATLPVFLNALSGKGVHVVTVNDYLARRDAVWMGQVYAYLGLTVSVVNGQNVSYMYDQTATTQAEDVARDTAGSFRIVYDFLRPCSRRDAYYADITYGTNNEFGFDYLRDNLTTQVEMLVQREPFFAVVDEIDSILIDEARTPLIISSATRENETLYPTFAKIAQSFIAGEDYIVDEKFRAITLTDSGIEKAERSLGLENIYTDKGIKLVHHLETAVRARALFTKDKEYVVQGEDVIIIDQSTGRMTPGRRFSQGLHQAIEAKEGVRIKEETKTVASITFQNYFRLYQKLAGMTGTALTSKEEFFAVYKLDVVSIPTNQSIARKDSNDLIYQSESEKLHAIAQKIKELHQKGQPVLVGTVSIEKNELVSAYLTKEGIPHKVLNAKNHEQESEIVAQAGKKKSVVIATNMAGRGVDIKLGGEPTIPEAAEEVKALGGLFVLGTERHESRRIDNQLRGRAGRQGDPGETQFYVSLEDELMRVFGGDRLKSMMQKLGVPENQPINNGFVSRALETAQKKIEGFHFDSRKNTLEYDNVLNVQRNAIYTKRRAILTAPVSTIETLAHEYVSDQDVWNHVMSFTDLAGKDQVLETIRRIILITIDLLWVQHLETMEYIRSSVSLRAYGQREPIIEYKKEGLRLFQEMEIALKHEITERLRSLQIEKRP